MSDHTLFPCKAGYFCPEGTKTENESPCPAGTYNPNTNAISISACIPCLAGGYCAAGSSTLITCPRGYYCPVGTGSGTYFPCPIGTYSNTLGLENVGQCTDCPLGHYCPGARKSVPNISPTPCPPGTYNNVTKAGHKFNCRLCEPGRSCPLSALSSSTDACEVGHYCPAGTITSNQFSCPPGTYTNDINLSRAEQCSPCPRSFACGWGTGLPSVPFLPCKQGHFCPEGNYYTLFIGN